MVRTQIYLTKQERDALLNLSRESGKKQSELIREAIDAFLAENAAAQRGDALKRLAGIWRNREDLPDFQRLRAEWDRT